MQIIAVQKDLGSHAHESIVKVGNCIKWSKIFDIFDKNRDGKIDVLELCVHLKMLTEEDQKDKARIVFQALDANHDGQLTLQELVASYQRSFQGGVELAVRAKRENLLGWLIYTVQGLHYAVESAEQSKIEKHFIRNKQHYVDDRATALLRKLDVNKDGVISLDEWLQQADELNKTFFG